MAENNQSKMNHMIVFYTGIERAFRTTSIFHLIEIAKEYPVILLSEEMSAETEEILKKKELFPKLEEIVQVRQLTGKKRNLFSKNYYLHKLAKEIVIKYKPTMVIMPADTFLLDFYLMRFAKKINATNIVLNSDLRLSTAKEMCLRSDLTHIYFDLPSFLPLVLRKFLVKIRKYLGYFFYNWVLPISVGELPFFGKSSRIFYSMCGKRADWRIVYSKQDYDLSLKEGIPAEKMIILNHPIKTGPTIFKRPEEKRGKTLTVLFPEEMFSFRRDNHLLIHELEMEWQAKKTVKLIADTMTGWQIIVKAHPAMIGVEASRKIFEAISPTVSFVNPKDPLDKYIAVSDAILGLPPATSALITINLSRPEMPILSLDLPPQEIFGDCYKDFKGIEYIDSEEKLIEILELIRNNKYCKENPTESETEGFNKIVKANIVKALDDLIKKA